MRSESTGEEKDVPTPPATSSGKGGRGGTPRGSVHPMTASPEAAGVVLVTMPFGPLLQPSLALSLLRQTVLPAEAIVLYETLQFASLIGDDLYNRITDGEPATTHLVGEWVFSNAAFGGDAARDDAYIREFLSDPGRPVGPRTDRRTTVDVEFRAAVLAARAKVDAYLDDALARVLRLRPRVVGFTSVFQQQVASLALARRIKEQRPEVTIVLGGANCEGEMGTAVLRHFAFVDVVVPGEGESAFPELVRRATAGEALVHIPGAVTRRDLGPLGLSSPACHDEVLVDVDTLPRPDFDDFFRQWRDSDRDANPSPFLLFESSRGCWWGQRRHCTFCGLNGKRMAFRSKSPERAVDELCALAARHPGVPIYAVDNIMDRRYFDDFLPMLAASAFGERLFYEVKANLTKDQLRLLQAAGVLDIQPGIESLHDSVLRLMRKGVTALQNVQLLKWCAEVGVRPHWNLLWGFPGEPTAAYDEMAALIPRLVHLEPPVAAGPIRLDRFSPHFDQAAEFGFRDVRPVPAYGAIYPLPPDALAKLAYFFAYDYVDEPPPSPSVEALTDAVAAWQASRGGAAVWSVDDGRSLMVWDLRPCATTVVTVLTGLERELFLACDSCRSLPELVELAGRLGGRPLAADAVREILGPLLETGLVITDGRRFLALAVPLGDRRIPSRLLARLAGALVRSTAAIAPAGAPSSGE